MIKIAVEIGDTILTGKFKNKQTVIKNIGTDEHGMPTINGRKVVTFRIKKKDKIGENKMAKKKQKLDEGMVMISTLIPAVGGVVGLVPKREDNFVFKGLPGQFNENGDKVFDEMGNKIEVEEASKIELEEKYTGKDADKYYKKLLDRVKKDLEELQDAGADFGIWQNAKSTASTLKKMYKMIQGLK